MVNRYSIATAILVSFSTSLSLCGQNTEPEADRSQNVIRVESRAVLVDVIVTDSSGKPVTRLPKDAFMVTEQGKPQTITFFEENGVAPAAQPVEMLKLPPNTFSNFSPFPQPPAVNVLLLDSLNTRMEDQSVVHSQAMKFLTGAKPGTRTAIFTMGLGLHFIQGFNDDPSVLAAALNNKKNIEVENSAMLASQIETNAEAKIPSLAGFFAEQVASHAIDREFRTLADLQRLAVFLQGFPGRKNIIWFTEKVPGGFVIEKGQLISNPTIDDEIRKTLAMLGTARAAIYPVDARGTSVNAQYTAENNPAGMSTAGEAIRDEDKERNSDQLDQQTLAEQSGGRAFVNTNDLSGIIDKVTSESAHFYTLSYVPTNTKMDGVFRNIGVKIAGGSYRLSYRRGYFAVDTDRRGPTNIPNQEVKKLAVQSLEPVDPLLPFMDLGMPQSEQILYKVRIVPSAPGENEPIEKKDKKQYKVDFAIDLNDLKLSLDAVGIQKGTLNLSLIVYDRYGNVISREDHLAELNIKPDAYAAFRNTGVQLHAELAVPKGNYWLRTGVYDHGSRKVGTMEVALSSVVPLQVSTATKETMQRENAKVPNAVPSSSADSPSRDTERITVEQLEQLVNQLHVKTDKEASQRLAKCKLTERLSTVRLDRLQDSLPGERSRMALLAIANVSEFLDLPSSDLDSSSPVPNQAVQKQILSRAVDFVLATTAKMPDFIAQKKTLRFQDTKFGTYENEPVIVTPDQYHLIDSKVEAVQYRNGQEEGANPSSKHEQHEAEIGSMMGLTTHGLFGPMLQTVMRDILSSRIGWNYWEKSPSGPVATFRYSVPEEKATFTVTWCCVDAGPGIFREIQTVPRYHGEISVNPESGVITRLVLKADMDPGQQVSTADVYVEYGPVEIGAKTYLCPTRSATLLVANSPIEHGKYTRGGETVWHESMENINVTSVSDTRFERYHVFRSDMRMVPEGDE